MNLQTFLESGLLESYILGQATAEERKIVEQMLAEHEMARREKDAIEKALEQYAQARAVAPPGWMRGRILDQIGSMQPPAARPSGTLVRNIGTWLLAAAALAATALYYNTLQTNNRLETERTQLQQQAQNCETERAASEKATQAQMAFLTDPATRGVRLNWIDTTINAPGAVGMAFNNPDSAATYIRLSNLPVLAANQDYQFWVITAGNPNPQPLDVIRYQDSVLIRTQYRDQAQAFAMSIEPKGGSPNGAPTRVVMLGT